jgi:hypothetical protein
MKLFGDSGGWGLRATRPVGLMEARFPRKQPPDEQVEQTRIEDRRLVRFAKTIEERAHEFVAGSLHCLASS